MEINEKQYETILAALADKIKEQATTIYVQKCQIETLKLALSVAESNKEKETTEIR